MTKELILRFFKNQCNAEEATEVAAYLQQHPELLEEFLPDQAWNELENEVSLFPEDKKTEILNQLRLKLDFTVPKKRNLWWLSAAASLFLLLGIGYLMNKKPAEVQVPEVMLHNLVKMNYGKEAVSLAIEDGSVVLLKPGSELRYPEHFQGNDRSFYLKGEARFKVAKDPERPFNVHAGGTVTTALGTDFTITANSGESHTRIFLHEGRVVVRPEQPQKGKTKEVYLNAGEQLSVNRTTFDNQLAGSEKKTEPRIKVAGSTEITLETISFKNQSLENIFHSLDKELSTRIHFKAHEMSGRYFTGAFKRDSLTADRIIKEIALLNKLKIDKRDSTYYLSLQQNHH
ncbi:FecR family protein [Pedobacter caeni]|uniref:FecR family protein n=2 Tax=Pedobacter caeni TaxID=288992 RepID=A0A1M5JV59_9SPHI|nr:FecR family protein [Pedobacter caeni]